jgi:hypothetical protein
LGGGSSSYISCMSQRWVYLGSVGGSAERSFVLKQLSCFVAVSIGVTVVVIGRDRGRVCAFDRVVVVREPAVVEVELSSLTWGSVALSVVVLLLRWWRFARGRC